MRGLVKKRQKRGELFETPLTGFSSIPSGYPTAIFCCYVKLKLRCDWEGSGGDDDVLRGLGGGA